MDQQQGKISSAKSADRLKQDGNGLFTLKRYKDALSCYNRALVLDPAMVCLYSNRALCHLRLSQYDQALAESQVAVKLQPSSVKAVFFRGCALMELGEYDDAVNDFKRAQCLAREQQTNFGDDICQLLRACKKRRWQVADLTRTQKDTDLHSELKALILSQRDRSPSETIRSDAERASATSSVEDQLAHLDDVFSRLRRADSREIPDFFCGKISFEIMREPVVTPSGITYDRGDIEEHLSRVGHFDPISRRPLTADQLIPNIALKEIVEEFLEANPWAEDF